MKLLYAQEPGIEKTARSLFLAGPSPRGNDEYDWRKDAIVCLKRLNFEGAVYIPLPRDGLFGQEDFDHTAQIEWELKHLEHAQVIVFWIPRDLKSLPGFTTNVEFGRFSRSGRAILGYPENTPKMRYLHHIAQLDKVPIFHTLEETLLKAVEMTAAS